MVHLGQDKTQEEEQGGQSRNTSQQADRDTGEERYSDRSPGCKQHEVVHSLKNISCDEWMLPSLAKVRQQETFFVWSLLEFTRFPRLYAH